MYHFLHSEMLFMFSLTVSHGIPSLLYSLYIHPQLSSNDQQITRWLILIGDNTFIYTTSHSIIIYANSIGLTAFPEQTVDG